MTIESRPHNTPASSPLTRFSDAAAHAGRAVALVAALCYGLGLTVANIHFGKFGYHSFGLVRTNYVTAGLWSLLILWFSALGIIFFRAHFSDVRGPRRQRIISYAKKGFYFVAITYGLLNYLSGGLHVSSGVLFYALFWGLLLISSLWQNTPAPGRVSDHPAVGFFQSLRHRALIVPFVLPWLMVALIVFLTATARLWGQLPLALGGGRPTSIVLTVDSAVVSRATLSAAGLSPDSAWAIHGCLVSREDQYFVITPVGHREAVLLPVRATRLTVFDSRSESLDVVLARNEWMPQPPEPWYKRMRWYGWLTQGHRTPTQKSSGKHGATPQPVSERTMRSIADSTG